MSFLTPLFLLGALAVALPVVFHLIRRTSRERTPFSSLMFLFPTPPRLTRRSRLEHLLLLLLRCAAVCLLAAGFARPFFKKAISSEPPNLAGKRIVVLVDTSASMRRQGLWPEARHKVESLLSKTSAADEVALFTFDRQTKALVSFEQWKNAPSPERAGLAARRLADISPGWSGTQLGYALITAAEALTDPGSKSSATQGRIVLISDLQEGSRLDPLSGYEWPKGIELSVEVVKPRHADNASLQLITGGDEGTSQAAESLRVRVSNAAVSQREQFKVGWARAGQPSFAGEPMAVYVPPGQSRTVTLPAPARPEADGRILLQGDDEDFDNVIFAIAPESTRSTVLYFGSDSEKDPKQQLYFLQRAFQETRLHAVRVLARSPTLPVPASEAEAAALFVITDSLSEQCASMLRSQITAGKTALLSLTSATAGSTLAALVEVPRPGVEEAQPNRYAMLADIDFHHPLLASFADPRYSDFTKIHFWKYRRLDLSAIARARVLARFDSGDPALVEIPAGKGRLLVLTSGWQPQESQLALSTKFVPLLYSMLEESGAWGSRPKEYHVGDVVPLRSAVSSGETGLVLRLPDGTQATLPAGETNFSQTFMPGVYTLTSAGTSTKFAVNLDPSESRTSPLSADDLERLGAPVSRQVLTAARETDRKLRLRNTDLEDRQKVWRWFIVTTLAVLALETWLAGLAARRSVPPAGANAS